MIPVILLGAGGHAKVVLEILLMNGIAVQGVICPQLAAAQQTHWRGIAVLGADEVLDNLSPDAVLLANGLGMLPNQLRRMHLFLKMKSAGFHFVQVLHPTAVISDTAQLGEGVHVFAGAVIQADSVVADNVIVNTRAVVEHDAVIGAHSHIAPGAVICGHAQIGCEVFVGAGATVIQSISIGNQAVIGAGAVVVRHLPIKGKCRPAAVVRRDTSDSAHIGDQ